MVRLKFARHRRVASPSARILGAEGDFAPRARVRVFIGLVLCTCVSILPTGCALVPKSRLDDAAKVTQSLRAENAQLKDTTLSLKGENADLTRRALNDSRKIAAIEDANSRLESSVQAYIDEREDLNDAFQRFKRTARASISSPSSALQSRLKSFSNGHPGTSYDPQSGLISVQADVLFVPGTNRLRPDSARLLADLAAILTEPELANQSLLVTGHSSASPVKAASTAAVESIGDTAAVDVSLARAVAVRDAIARQTRRDPAQIGIAGLGNSRSAVVGNNDRETTKNARIEIDLNGVAPLPR